MTPAGIVDPAGEKKANLTSRLLGEERVYNRFYGHDRILRHYAQVGLPYRLPGLVQHGWMPGCGIHADISLHDDTDRAATYFVWSERNLAQSRTLGYRNAVAIGAPLLYLKGAIAVERPPTDRSLVLFPMHAAEKAPLIGDPAQLYANYLESLSSILEQFEPVTACLYWMEHADPRIRQVFEAKGINVTSLGHRDGNPGFLDAFVDLTRRHAYATSNHFSTAVFYSLYLGARTFVHGPTFELKLLSWEKTAGTVQEGLALEYPELLWDNFDGVGRRGIGEQELGAEFKRTPAELRRLFGWRPSVLFALAARRTQQAVRRRLRPTLFSSRHS